MFSVARNAALSALVGGIAETVSALTLSSTSPAATASAASAAASSSVGDGDGDGGSSAGGKTKDYRMDVQDFVE